MTRILLTAAALAFGLSAAGACNYQRSVQADTGKTVVASADKDATPVSKPVASPDEDRGDEPATVTQ